VGCGGGSSTGAISLDPVAAAATKSQHAGAARIHFSLALSSPQIPGKSLHLRASGAIDGSRSRLTFKLGSLIKAMGMPKGVAPDATMAQLAHSSLQEISLEQHGDYVIYLQLGVLGAQLPAGKQWVKLDVSKLGRSAGLDLGKLLSGSQVQPTDLLGMLRGEDAKIRKLGPARIGGVSTTHYRVTIDVAKALESKGLTSPLLGGVAADLPKLPEDVWIGKDGLVRRVRVSYSVAQSGKRVHLGMTMDISGYGAHLRIAAPPGNAVFDATQLAQQGIGSSLLH
jgi:hypothetical protein